MRVVPSRVSRLLGCALLVSAAAAAWGADDDLMTARNALHDKLDAVAATHAEQRLRETQGQPAEGVEALCLLLQARAEQHQDDQVLTDLDTWRAVVEAAPDPGTFAFWRALALLELGRAGEALHVAEQAAAQKVSAENADALARLTARARLALGDTPTALALYAEVDKRSTNAATRAANLLEWAAALETVGRAGDALGVLVRQLELNVVGLVTDEGRLSYGRLLARQGRTADAETALRSLGANGTAAEFCRVQAWVEVSHLQLAGGRTNEAVASVRSADALATRAESRRLAAFQLADLLLAAPATLDEGVTRMKAFVRAFPEGPSAAAAQFRLAEALLRQGRPEQAAAEYRVFLETFSDRDREAAALTGLGTALFRMGRFGESANLLQKAHDRGTNETDRAACLLQAGDAMHAAGQFRQAAQTYRQVATLYPTSSVAPRALFQTADSLERADDADGAQAAFAQVAKQCGDQSDLAVQAWLRLAALQAARGATDQAIETYTRVLNITTNAMPRGEALMGRGRAHYHAYHFEAAGSNFVAAAATQAAWRDEAEFLRTMCLYGLGRDEDAHAAAVAYLGAYTNSTRLSEMVLWLAKFDFNANRLEEAGRRFLEYAARWPQGAWADAALLWAGRAAFRRPDYQQTIDLMSRLQREYPRSAYFAESRFIQGDALCGQARFDEAVVVFDEIIARYPDSDWVTAAWSRKGDALFSLGTDKPAHFAEAAKAYAEVLARRDATPEATLQAAFKIGRCLEKMKQNDAALDQYYSRVIVRYLDDRRRGVWYSEAAGTWFVRAAFQAAELLEQKNQIDQAVQILNRVVQAGVPGKEEAQQRIQRLRKEH